MQAFTSFVNSQPNNVPFVFAYKGKYIVKVNKSTEGSAHVDAYYYVDNSQNLVDHDFEAGVPAAGQLTIEKTSHVTPGSTAAFATELRAFLTSLGLANINLTSGRAFNWYDAIAAYYEAPVLSLVNLLDEEDNAYLGIKYGDNVYAPKVTLNGTTGYMPAFNRISLAEVPAACPVSPNVFEQSLVNTTLVDSHTDVAYNITMEACDAQNGFMMSLAPVTPGTPAIRIRGYFKDGGADCIYCENTVVGVEESGVPSLEVGESVGVVINGYPTRVTKTSEDAALIEVDSTGGSEYPCHKNLYIGEPSYPAFSDLYILYEYDSNEWSDIEGEIQGYLSVSDVTVQRGTVSLEDCTHSFEV